MNIFRVIAIFKTGDAHEFSNYRPVSILPSLSLLFKNTRIDISK